MNYRLCDEVERTDTGPMQHNETHYEYLNRSDRPEVEKIRSQLEDWFNMYPEKEKGDFINRFRGKEHNKSFLNFTYMKSFLDKTSPANTSL